MNNTVLKLLSLPRMRAKTEFIQDQSHLCIQLKSLFPPVFREKPQNPEPPHEDTTLQTNFGISVNSAYSFILLHLRNKGNKNPINVQIPEVCIFSQRATYDVVYSARGYIRGYRTGEVPKMRLKNAYKIFKEAWGLHGLPKNQQCVAGFLQKQMLMLSDNDLYLITCKTKQDPFFKKLQYIRNKLPPNNNTPLISPYKHTEQQDKILKLATQSLLAYRSEQEVREQIMSEEETEEEGIRKYLRFLDEKIVLFLNYQHNIRVRSCQFVYVRANDGAFYLVNVHKLDFTNLTSAILQRQKRLAQRQQQRNKILQLTPERQARYRSFQNKPNTKNFQSIMQSQFKSVVNKLNLNTISDNKRQEVKNQLAYKKLHPKARFTYTEVLGSTNFMKVKDQILGNLKRKPITMPSRYVMRFYNKVRSDRLKTQVIDVMDF